MEEEVGFEPTDARASSVFKTDPINQALAPFLKSGGERGIRTLGSTFKYYNGLANRRFKPSQPSRH